MFERLSPSSGAIIIIFIVFIGVFFLCSTLSKFTFYLISKFKKTDYSGREVYDYLKIKENYEDSTVKEKVINFASNFYSYKKNKNEFIISKKVMKQENLWAVLLVAESFVYANEMKRRSLQFKWQFVGIALLSVVPYLCLLAMLLLTFIPSQEWEGGRIAMRYYLSAEALAIFGWIIILISYFWWMSAIQNYAVEIEDMIKKLNNKNLNFEVKAHLNVCSYIPFSIRTVI